MGYMFRNPICCIYIEIDILTIPHLFTKKHKKEGTGFSDTSDNKNMLTLHVPTRRRPKGNYYKNVTRLQQIWAARWRNTKALSITPRQHKRELRRKSNVFWVRESGFICRQFYHWSFSFRSLSLFAFRVFCFTTVQQLKWINVCLSLFYWHLKEFGNYGMLFVAHIHIFSLSKNFLFFHTCFIFILFTPLIFFYH